MIDLLGFAVLGAGIGVLTGLLPGVHVNNIAPVLVGLTLGATLEPLQAISLIVAAMITHTFLDFIPSTFLGVPNKDTALSVLPAHKLVLDGRGYEVIKLTALGSLGALMLSVALIGLLAPVIGPAYEFIKPYMHWLLIGMIGVMILLERRLRKMLWATGIFFLAGFLGLLVLDTNVATGVGAFMPLLGGLFGLSVLLISVNAESSFPKQEISNEPVELRANARSIFAGTSAGFLTGILPGVGPAQGTVLTQLATRSGGTRDFLVGVSGVNTAKALLSFVALYVIGNPRSGAAVAVDEIIDVGSQEVLFLIGLSLFIGGIAAVLHLRIGKFAARHIQRLPYREMCFAVVLSVIGFSIYYAGMMGLLILGTATAVGLLPPALGVKRTHCMGCIILPCILYFAGLKGTLLAFLGF